MASDMRLNDKPIAKDGAYIYAEAADGSQVKISKADLASVVAGVTKKTFVLTPSGVEKIGNTNGGFLIINSGINQATGVYSIPRGDSGSIGVVLKVPGEGSYFSLTLVDGEIIITNLHTAQIAFWVEMISL